MSIGIAGGRVEKEVSDECVHGISDESGRVPPKGQRWGSNAQVLDYAFYAQEHDTWKRLLPRSPDQLPPEARFPELERIQADRSFDCEHPVLFQPPFPTGRGRTQRGATRSCWLFPR